MRNTQLRYLFYLLIFNLVAFPVYADLVPTADTPWYYTLGGGQSIPSPAYRNAFSVPLHVESDVGLGYNCGLFNPTLSITNSLNAIENSFQGIQKSLMEHATVAMMQFPLYAISRADPALYHLLNNALLGAREDFNLSMKSCQQMQSTMDKGQNPYHDWMTLSMGNDWKRNISLINDPKSTSETNPDINQVKSAIEKANGDKGVPWVHGTPLNQKGFYAGGRNQPPIFVLRDTAIAGYNVVLQTSRDYDDLKPPKRTEDNAHLVDTWSTPTLAAQWITNVLGDEKITTFAQGDKQSSPGVGLLPDNHVVMQSLLPKLQALVDGKQTLTIDRLKEVSAPGVMINRAVIEAIRQKPPVTQAMIMNKLAQEVATSIVLDKALLAQQLLQEGAQVPAIYANKAAQTTIERSVMRLQQAMQQLLFHAQVRKTFVSETAAQLLAYNQAEQLAQASIKTTPLPPLMQQGALKP
jgi:integrating conjugative element protein (TIGR03755 family)